MTSLEERIGTVGVQLTDSLVGWRQAENIAPAGAGAARRIADERSHRLRVATTDTVLVVSAVCMAFALQLAGLVGFPATSADTLTVAGVLTVVAWATALGLGRTRNSSVMARPEREFRHIVLASLLAVGVLSMVFVVTNTEGLRPFLLIAVPTGTAFLLLSRMAWRRWLRQQRAFGHNQSRALIVGTRSSIEDAAEDVQNDPSSSYRVAGTLLLDHDARMDESLDLVRNAMLLHGADSVIVTGQSSNEPRALRQLAWALEGTAVEVIVPSGISDVSAARIRVEALDDQSFVRVALPTFAKRNPVKRAFDVVVSGALIVLLAPLLAFLALAIKVSSPGPILYRQVRVGLNGNDFRMIKFRSMRIGADAELASLLEARGAGDTPLFKIKDDPRVTPIGRFIRKYSLDELPQLFNVFGGSMSLVGPRPQIADEVALYSDGAERRLLSPPGVTGLWQVSGRSSLTWEQAMRLDLYYVENWSLLGDLAILARTARAVLAPGETAH
jgi:exopolysaccharide biosynthesis polyprenyl glycosylphosphotransferase